jgi:hypothetical protein
MALPTLTKTWQFSTNNIASGASTLDISRTFHLAVKNAMTGFASSPWAMGYSCNSVTAGTAGDGVDRLTTNANFVWGNAGAAHSWWVLKQTGIATNHQVLFSCESNSATGASFTIVVSPNAGFTGGTTTARPTATDEIVIYSSSAWTPTSGTAQIRWNLMQSTDGQCTRLITFTGGTAQNQFIFEKPYQPVTGWSNASASWAAHGTQLTYTTLGSLSGALSARIGSTAALLSMSAESLITGVANGGFATNTNFGNIANEVTGEWPMLPLGMISVTNPVRGRTGTFQDLWIGSGAVNLADTYPSGTSRQFVQFGCLIFPWDGSVPVLS